MSTKIALLLFTTAVLLTSFAVVAIPPASALTQNTFDDSHTTARFGNSKVCGDHLCAPGEHAKWVQALNDAQRANQVGHSKNAQHGEDVIHQLALQGSSNSGMQMTGNMTGNNMPSGK
ncbi:MAG: hypothetical protein ABI340_01550 [Nitrososphaera sp.]|jgi:hypothetical protein